MNIVEIKDLTKNYGELKAVDNVSIEVKKGEVFALLGPNGAGKTTIIKSMIGALFPTAGEIKINGFDVVKDGRKARKNIGYLPENVSFYDNLTAMQTMEFYAELRGASKEECLELLKNVGLEGEVNKKVGNYSKGMVQRLGVAQVMIGNPSLLILDEPTGGLDPKGSWQIRQKIKDLNENGTTIFISSHILSEVQEVSDRVAILNHGKLIAIDTLDNLGKKLDLQPVLKIELQRPSTQILSRVKQVKGVKDARLSENVINVTCNPRAKLNIINAIEGAGGKIIDFKTVEPSLEEVFLKFTGE